MTTFKKDDTDWQGKKFEKNKKSNLAFIVIAVLVAIVVFAIFK